MREKTANRWPLIYAGVALTTLSMLLLELSLTRIFSVIFYYHFAFLAISIALFGLGAGGVFSYVAAGWRGSLFSLLGWLSAANSLVVIAAVAFLLGQRTDPSGARLALVYFAAALPFFLGGMIVSLVIAETIERVDRVYFFDLLGAAGGCLLLVPLLDSLGGPNTTMAAAVALAVAAAVWHQLAASRKAGICAATLALLIAGFIAWNGKHRLIDIAFAKGAPLRNEIFVKWNSFSRIAARLEEGWPVPAIFIDADANTGICDIDLDRLSEEHRRALLQTSGAGIPYLLRPGAKSLIIGPGGGWDVAHALLSGSRDVIGVEINPIIATTIMRGRFAAASHGLYFRPEVRIFVEDGRSFVRRSPEKYQVIQATLVDTWAATAAGAFALSENNLYTTEAFYDYLTHLTDDGLLAFTRWGFEPPRESLRLVSLAVAALGQLGEPEPWRHVIVKREGTRRELATIGAKDTVLIARKPFSAEDVARARESLKRTESETVYLPGERIPNPFAEMLRSRDPRAYQRAYPFDISPVSDNRPFFFYTVQPRDLRAFLRASQAPVDYKINRAVPLLFGVVGVSLLATLLTLALPPLLLGARLPREPGVAAFLLYFVAIGAGYILVEVALIQKFVLFLGHPTYALTVVIFSMLVSSGLGSRWSSRIRSVHRMPAVAAALVAVAALMVGPLLSAGVGWPLWIKVAVTVVVIFPLGFVMGMPFPSGLTRLERWHPPAVRWAWSLNAASSVLGSAAAMFAAIYLGLIQSLLIGGALYLAAAAIFRRYSPRLVLGY